MKLGLIVLILVLLSGCAELAATKQAIKHGGAALADKSLTETLWKLCNATSYGAIKRMYAKDASKARALIIICGGNQDADLIDAVH